MKNNSLETRQAAEKAFHDKRFAEHKTADYYELGFKSVVTQRFLDKLGDITDKRVLEFGCGPGWLTKMLATRGARLRSFDISTEAVVQTRTLVGALVTKHPVQVDQMAGERLAYDSASFDLVVGNAILHHLDLEECLLEIKRVLKVGGKACFMEPLGHNPILNLYRWMTPNLRSRDEVPMRFDQFDLIGRHFPDYSHEEFYLTAILALSLHYLRLPGPMLKARDILCKLDRTILKMVPAAQKFCWYSILEFRKTAG